MLRHRERALRHDADRRTARVVLALAHQRLGGVGAAVEEDPTLGRNAERARAPDRGEDHRGALIDAVARVHQPAVGQRDERVLAFGRRQLARRARLREVGVGIPRGDLGERREQAAHRLEVLVEPDAAPMTDRLLEQRVDLGRERDAVRDLVGVEQRRPQAAVLEGAGHFLVPVELHPGAAGALERRDRLGAGEEDDLRIAVSDALGHQVDPLLRRVAADLDVDRVRRIAPMRRATDRGGLPARPCSCARRGDESPKRRITAMVSIAAARSPDARASSTARRAASPARSMGCGGQPRSRSLAASRWTDWPAPTRMGVRSLSVMEAERSLARAPEGSRRAAPLRLARCARSPSRSRRHHRSSAPARPPLARANPP